MTIPKTHDDWRQQTQSELRKSRLFVTLEARARTDPSTQHVVSLVDDVAYYAVQRSKLIVRHMGEFTLHDSDHLFRVLNLMERLLPESTLGELSVPELLLLLLSAFLHDIGLAPSEPDVLLWLETFDDEGSVNAAAATSRSFTQFVKARPNRVAEIGRLRQAGQYSKVKTIQDYLVAEYIRITHADRCRDILADDWNGKIRYRDMDLTSELADLCASHNDDPLSLLAFDASLICGANDYACLPFLGVVLRLADLLDFDMKRTPSVLFAHLGIRHPISLTEWQKHRQVTGWTIQPGLIAFAARCEHPAIEAAIRSFCDIIDVELVACSTVLRHMVDTVRSPLPPHYHLPLPPCVRREKIGPVKDVRGKPIYRFRDSRFNLSHSQIIELLMGTSLYGDAQVTLRELIQNSIDACRVRQAMEATWSNSYLPEIVVTFSERDNECILQVSDNGTGMDQRIIDKHFSHVGSSFYRSSEFYGLQAEHKMTFQPISRFGIGILSVFMVSDSVEVETRRLYGPHSSSDPLEIRIEGLESVFWVLDGTREQPGTSITLTLRHNHPWAQLTTEQRTEAIVKAVPHPPFPIRIISKDETIVHDGDSFCRPILSRTASSSPYIRTIDIDITDQPLGLAGTATVYVLQEQGVPCTEVEMFSRNVTVHGFPPVQVRTTLEVGDNEIARRADSLEIAEDDVCTSRGYSPEVRSHCDIAIYGISVPINILRRQWEAPRSKIRLVFPFALSLCVDVVDRRDLDLNTARSEIIFGEKWLDFSASLSFVICREVRRAVEPFYWQQLSQVWRRLSTIDYFLQSLDEAEGHDVPNGG